jgi:nitrate/nitrite-specific signal transduction histidine kinase
MMRTFSLIHSLRPSLARIVLAWSLVALILLFVLGGLLLRAYFSRIIIDTFQNNLLIDMETVELSMQPAFLIQNFDMLQHAVAAIAHQRHIDEIRLLTRDCLVVASSAPDELGIEMSPYATAYDLCNQEGRRSPTPGFQLTSSNSGTVLTSVNRIDNRIACQKCHPAEQAYLGILLVEYNLESMEQTLTRLDQVLLTGGIVLLLVSGLCLNLIFQLKITQPLKRLTGGDRDVGDVFQAGDLSRVLQHQQALSTSLACRESELEFRQRSLDALLSITQAMGENPTMENVFQTAINALRKATHFDSIGMRLHDPKHQCLRLIVHYGISPAMMAMLATVPDNRGFQYEALHSRWPCASSNLSTDQRLVAKSALDLGYRSYICVPLIAGEKIIGTMEMVSCDSIDWSEHKVSWLALIGRSIGTMINNVQLADHLRDLSVLQERAHLAQEIHDGLAQLLGSLRIWADKARLSFEEGDHACAQLALQKIETVAQDAYANLREEMLGLRDTFVPGKGLIPVLTEYLSRFQRQWGIETSFQFDRQNSLVAQLDITPAAEIQLLRIIQEGLTNVRRHAQASRIWVIIEQSGKHVHVKIRDNGQGFDQTQTGDDRLGLRIIGERAGSVGGSIDIQTERGKGTSLTIVIPMEHSGQPFPGI